MTQNSDKRTRVIGITGGVGSGKSEVLKYLEEEYGALVLRTDDMAKDMIESGGEYYDEAVELIGRDCLTEDGSFDRAKVAVKVFADKDLLQRYNAIIHPAVWRDMKAVSEAERRRGTPLVFIESALIVPKKDNETFDELWYVYASEPVRRERLKATRGYSDEKIDSIMANQISDDDFRTGCDVIIDNSGDLEDTKARIDRVLGEH